MSNTHVFYVLVPHLDGEVLFKFPTQASVDSFLKESKHLAPDAYQVTLQRIAGKN